MKTRTFALVVGIIYLLIGAMGFIPNFVSPVHADHPDIAVDAGYGLLLGLFPINFLHNIVHLAVGLLGVLAYRSLSGARTFAKGLAIFYGLLAVMGLIPGLNTTLGLIPIFGNDIWLHAVTAIAAAYFGFATPEAREYTGATATGGARTYDDR